MKKALILGASGLTGKKLLWLLLDDNRYSKVLVLVRKPIDIIHHKLTQIVYNFDQPDESVFTGVDELYCCLGTTIKKAGSKEAFYKVDYSYVISTAALALKAGTKKIAMVSSLGANKNSRFFYNRTKGAAEETLSGMDFDCCFIFRPSVLLGKRNEKRSGEMLARFLMANLSFLIPDRYKAIKSQTVALVMMACMNNSKLKGVLIVESDSIRKRSIAAND